MEKKRTYLKPSMRVVMLNAHAHLLTGSDPFGNPPNKFVDDPNWEWDEGGGN